MNNTMKTVNGHYMRKGFNIPFIGGLGSSTSQENYPLNLNENNRR